MNKQCGATLRGTIAENPVLILFLGACPAMAMSGSVISALGISAAVLAVMLLSNVVMWALRRIIPIQAKLACGLIVAAFFASAVQMLMNAFLPSVYQMMGVYLAVIAVNLLVFHEMEETGKRCLSGAVASALVNGIGLAAALFAMAAIREILGCGTFAGLEVPFFSSYNIPLLADAPGGLMVFGILLAVISKIAPAPKTASGNTLACTAAGVHDQETEAQGE